MFMRAGADVYARASVGALANGNFIAIDIAMRALMWMPALHMQSVYTRERERECSWSW